MVELEDMERAIMCQVAGKLIEALPEEERKKLLEASMIKTLKDMFRPWNVEQLIQKDVEKYMAEYVQQPEVQQKIKIATQDAVDRLMEGVINSVVIASQDAIKSEYRKFVEQKK